MNSNSTLSIHEKLLKEYENATLPNAILFEGERFSSKRTVALDLTKKILNSNDLNNPNILILSSIDVIEAKAYLTLQNTELVNNFLSYVKNILSSKYNFSSDKNLKKLEKNINAINNAFYSKNYNEKTKVELISNIEEIVKGLSFHITINEIRKIQTWAFSEKGKNKVIYINQIENLSLNVFNSLLKILEEPPTNVYFILSSRNKNKIPKTILSRLRTYRLSKGSKNNEIKRFQNAFKKNEDLTIEEYFNSFYGEETLKIKEEVNEILNKIEKKEEILNFEKLELIKDEQDFKIFINELVNELRKKYLNGKIDINKYIKFLDYTKEIQKNIVYNQSKKSIIENLILSYEDK